MADLSLRLPFSLVSNYSNAEPKGVYSYGPVFRAEMTFFYLRQGSVSARIGKQQIRLESDQFLCVMPQVEHSFQSADMQRPFFYDAVIFDPDALQCGDTIFSEFYKSLKTRKSSISFVVSDASETGRTILGYLSELVSTLKTPTPVYENGCRAFIELILFKLVSLSQVPHAAPAEDQKLQPVISYIESNYMDKISVDTLARLCFMSNYHFIRYFYSVTRQTPVEYINSFRIKTACRLLREQTNTKIITIALSVGFNDVSNFNRTFKRATGLTPAEFRKQALKQEEENQQSIYYEESVANVPFYSFML